MGTVDCAQSFRDIEGPARSDGHGCHSMAESQFYASVYEGSLQKSLDSPGNTQSFQKSMKSVLPEFYASVLVFSTKAKGYFLPLGSGELPWIATMIGPAICPNHSSAKLTSHLEPFSVTLELCLKEIHANRQRLERLATMATMERINDRNVPGRE